MEALDKKWFEEYLAVGSFDELDFISKNNSKEQKELFLAGKIDNPNFTYEVDLENIQNKESGLRTLKDKITTEEKNDLVKEVYLKAIDYKLKMLDLAKMFAKQDNSGVYRLSVELYGAPDSVLYRQGLGMIKYLSEKYGITLNQDFKALLADVDILTVEDFQPIDRSPLLDATEVKSLFEQKLRELNLDWVVELNHDSLSLNVGTVFTKKISIPADKKWTENVVQGLLEHEIGVHIRRAENGLKSLLLLLANGLPGYLVGEEGLAMYMELQTYKSKLPGVGNYLATALAQGVDNKAKTFREVFNLMKEYQLLIQNINGANFDDTNLNNKAWEFAWRAFRGTTGDQTTGECFTRDTVYFSGYNNIKNLFETNSPELERLFVGKYDPANVEHIKILDQLA